MRLHRYMYATTLFLVVFFFSFLSSSGASSLFPRSPYVLVIGAIFQLAGLTKAISICSGGEFFRETVYRISLGAWPKSREQGNTGETGPVDATELMAAVAPPSRAVELNAYLREKQRKINVGVFRVSAETTGRFVRIRTQGGGREERRPSAANR